MDINYTNNLTEKNAVSTGENLLLDSQKRDSDDEQLLVEKIDEKRIDISESDHASDLIMPDKIPIVTLWRLILLIRPIVMHVYDFVNDIGLAIEYFGSQKTAHCGFTLAFTMLRAITTTWISYMIHHPKLGVTDGQKEINREENWLDKISTRIARCGIIITCLLSVPLCHLKKLHYAWRLRRCQLNGNETAQLRNHQMMLNENRDLGLLGVVACCLQAAPQLILQLYILITENEPISYLMWFKIVGGCVTLFNLGSSMKGYYCAIREAQPDRAKVSRIGKVLLFLWHFGVIAARIFTIAISASNWLSYTIMGCMINWTIWTLWIYAKENVTSVILFGKKTADSSAIAAQTLGQEIRNLFFSGILAVVYTFTLVNLREGRSIFRNSAYYVLCVLQNATVLVLYYILTCNANVEDVWLSKYILISSVILFFVGITAMITYYKFCHPSSVQNLHDPEIDESLLRVRSIRMEKM